ncbi:hypothetical protein KGV52_01100 [Candidatus Gracilibacteria bacterium]|nr:hypothetical protein [Candidatus Gracilibacteria bacterium]
MKKIKFSKRVRKKIYNLLEHYHKYYEKIYEDSELWNEENIIQNYIQEADYRQENMVDTITKILENDVVSYPNGTAVIRWKTKYLMIRLTETEDARIIEDIDIR